MNTSLIDSIITKTAELAEHEYNLFDLKDDYAEIIQYKASELGKFLDHLIEKAQKFNLAFLKNNLPIEQITELLKNANFPVVVFSEVSEGEIVPYIIYKGKNEKFTYYNFKEQAEVPIKDINAFYDSLVMYEDAADQSINGEVIFLTAVPLRYIVSDYYFKDDNDKIKLTPLRRLFRLLRSERKDIFYVYVYAIVVGLISLSLPLGIQATISLISGGMIFSSVVVLIALVIIGVLVGGALQVMQISLVEIIQQRVFAKASFEIAFRITKIRTEALEKYYPPELMNRFFDVVTVQKGLPKLFVDITGAVIQIFFGLILLSLYHPVFLMFSIFLVLFVGMIFYFTGSKGLETSIKESTYKYKVAYWLEELARTVYAFKQAGNTNLPMQQTDKLVNSYLFHRRAHFRILITQFINIVAFKTLITGGLLILGTILVVDRQITLGQFVASEVIIILVVGSVEKLIISLDTVYDLLTGVEKVATITDLPTERQSGLRIDLTDKHKGMHLFAKGVKYKYKNNTNYTLKEIAFEVQPGESVCIAGPNDSGKHTLVKVITGLLTDYEGVITVNHLSLHDISLGSLRDVVNKHLTFDEIFDGTILDNITMGRSNIHHSDVIWAIENVGLTEYIATLPNGLSTHIGYSGKKLSSGIVAKLLLARSVASHPKLLIVNDFSEHIPKNEKLKILSFLQEKSNGWTLIILSVSDDPILLSSCDKILLMNKGKVVAEGSYEKLLSEPTFQKLIFKGR